MIKRTQYVALPAVMAALLLAGCQAPEEAASDKGADTAEDTSEESAGKPPEFAGSAWLTVGVDGAVQTTFFDPDGQYRDLRNGAEVATGTWEQRADGELCFEPDQGLGACWTAGNVEDDGTAIATDSAGKRVEIKRVSYIATPDADDEETGG